MYTKYYKFVLVFTSRQLSYEKKECVRIKKFNKKIYLIINNLNFFL